MFSRVNRVRQAPHIAFNYPPDGPIRLDEVRLDAWARALDQDGYPRQARRSHRGQLPDVDYSRIEPAPVGTPLLVRLWRSLTRRRAEAKPSSSTGAITLGESPSPSHMTQKAPIACSPGPGHAKDGPCSRAA